MHVPCGNLLVLRLRAGWYAGPSCFVSKGELVWFETYFLNYEALVAAWGELHCNPTKNLFHLFFVFLYNACKNI